MKEKNLGAVQRNTEYLSPANCANLSRSDWLINSQTFGPIHSFPWDEKEAVGRKQMAKASYFIFLLKTFF